MFVSLNLQLFHTLRWRHNDHAGVSNHQPYGCLLNRLFRRRSKKTSKLCVTGLCVGNSIVPVNSPHKWPVTRKMSPFDDVIMTSYGGIQTSLWEEWHLTSQHQSYYIETIGPWLHVRIYATRKILFYIRPGSFARWRPFLWPPLEIYTFMDCYLQLPS